MFLRLFSHFEDTMWKPPKEITRNELYRQIWAEPMVTVAQRYGLSDRGLAKICQRHQIPRPPRGYWAKKAAGVKVRKARLPSPNSNAYFSVLFPDNLPPSKALTL